MLVEEGPALRSVPAIRAKILKAGLHLADPHKSYVNAKYFADAKKAREGCANVDEEREVKFETSRYMNGMGRAEKWEDTEMLECEEVY